MIIVFSFSNQNGSESSGLSTKLANALFSKADNIQIIEHYIRKLAHLTEYAIGGVLFMALLLTYKISDIMKIIGSILIGMEYAITDEIHQLAIEGRNGSAVDVLIDTIGVAIGSCILMFIYKLIIKLRKKEEGVKN